MARTLVVSQPMFMPWVGLFEQVRLADVFIHYDDVQLPQGRSFVSRVQIKVPTGVMWLSAPVDRRRSGRAINEVQFAPRTDWRRKHLKTIEQSYAKAPFRGLMLSLASEIYSCPSNYLAEFNMNAIEVIARWLGLRPTYRRASTIDVRGAATGRLIGLCKHVGADVYVTGLGARNYLDHEEFAANDIAVRYMDYALTPYPQMFGPFTPYVSIVDAIANCGESVRDLVRSGTVCWRSVVEEEATRQRGPTS